MVTVIIVITYNLVTMINYNYDTAGKLSGIRRESVNYVGYYSAHEETMKTIIQSQVTIIISIVQ